MMKGTQESRDQGLGSHHSKQSNQNSIPYDFELVPPYISIESRPLGDYFSSALMISARTTL